MSQGDRTAIQASVLRAILHRLNAHPRLGEIFGEPVTARLAIVAEDGELRIVETGTIPLTQAQEREFLAVLDEVIDEVD